MANQPVDAPDDVTSAGKCRERPPAKSRRSSLAASPLPAARRRPRRAARPTAHPAAVGTRGARPPTTPRGRRAATRWAGCRPRACRPRAAPAPPSAASSASAAAASRAARAASTDQKPCSSYPASHTPSEGLSAVARPRHACARLRTRQSDSSTTLVGRRRSVLAGRRSVDRRPRHLLRRHPAPTPPVRHRHVGGRPKEEAARRRGTARSCSRREIEGGGAAPRKSAGARGACAPPAEERAGEGGGGARAPSCSVAGRRPRSSAPREHRRTTNCSSAVRRRAGGSAGSSRGRVELSARASRKRAPRTATPAVECRELGSTRAPRKSDRLPSSGTPSWRFGRELARAHSKVRARRRDTGERAAGAHFGCGSCQEFALSVHTPLQNLFI